MPLISTRVIIVIPTYNEREALQELVERIDALSIPGCSVLIVDDNSPDKTGALADRLSKIYPLRVIHRPKKEGLGRSYAYAFSELLNLPKHEQPQYVIQMDADLSHDPAEIPRLLEKIASCDAVLGSRYVRGGRVENWGAFRRLISYFGNLYARVLLNLPYRDLTSGYKCFRFGILKALDLKTISSVGYNFQIEMTYSSHKRGFCISEIPIVFTERKSGASKFHIGIILESFWRVLAIRAKNTIFGHTL